MEFLNRLRRLCRSLWTDKSGGAVLYTAILMPALVGFTGLGIDVSLWHVQKRHIQSVADAAAISAALEIFRSQENANIWTTAVGDIEPLGFNENNGDTIILNSPPQSGSSAGVWGAVEAIVRAPVPQLFSSVLGLAPKFVSARSVARGGINSTCLWSLNPEISGAIAISGGANVEFSCGVFANSNHAEAIDLSGAGSCLAATMIEAVGGVSGECITPDPIEGATPRTDPLATIVAPTSLGCDQVAQTNITGQADATMSPGTYCGSVSITTSGTVTMQPGVYIFDRSGLSIGAQANVVGTGVTIYFTENGHINDNLTINSGAHVTLSAPDTGDYAGILLYHDRNSTENIAHRLTGGADMDLTGIVYAPNNEILFSGGSAANSAAATIISDSLAFTGNSYIHEYIPGNRLVNPLLVEVRIIE